MIIFFVVVVTGIKSAELKLVRAGKHLRAIKRCIAIYAASKPHKIILKSKRKKKLNIPKSPPREICVLVGEMVYQMRSALDHLAFELVKRNPSGKSLPHGWDTRSQFPLYVNIPTKGKPPVPYTLPAPYNIFSRELPNIPMKAFTFIESVQPYYGNTAICNLLGFLAKLSNIDKHRHLHIIRPRTQEKESVRFESGLNSRSTAMLDRGAQIESPASWRQSDRTIYVHRRYKTRVAFDERAVIGEATLLPLEYLLEMILETIKRVVAPNLKNLIKNP
jgi:hypothetical protein